MYDYFNVNIKLINDENNNKKIYIIDNPLMFDNYVAFIQLTDQQIYKALNNYLYYVKIDKYNNINNNFLLNDLAYKIQAKNKYINDIIIPIKMYHIGSNMYNNILDEIKINNIIPDKVSINDLQLFKRNSCIIL